MDHVYKDKYDELDSVDIPLKDKLWMPSLLQYLPDYVLKCQMRLLDEIVFIQPNNIFINFIYLNTLEEFYKYYLLVYEECIHRNIQCNEENFKQMLKYTNMHFNETDSKWVRCYEYHKKVMWPYSIVFHNPNKEVCDYYDLLELYTYRPDLNFYPTELWNELNKHIRYTSTLHLGPQDDLRRKI